MPRMDIAFHDGIELQDLEAQPAGFLHAVLHQLFSYVKASGSRGYGIACVADVTAAADIVRMEDVQSQQPAI